MPLQYLNRHVKGREINKRNAGIPGDYKMKKILLFVLLFPLNSYALTYTTDLNLVKPAARETNYIAPFATGMDTLDAAIPDKRVNKTAVFASSLTVSGPFTASSSATITGSAFSVGGSTLVVSAGQVGIGSASPLSALMVTKQITEHPDTGKYGQIEATLTNTAYRMSIGYDSTLNGGFLQAIVNGASYQPIAINPRGGNVGIGTISPGTALDVVGAITLSGAINSNGGGNRVYHIGATVTDSIYSRTRNSDGSVDSYFGLDNSVGNGLIAGGLPYGYTMFTGTNHPLVFGTNSNVRAVILGNGNVGIGTVSPGSKLDVIGGISASGDIVSSGTFRGSLTGTATALAANGANCSAGQAPLGVDASGAVEGCYTPAGAGDVLLIATQTFTGQNTFSPNITTISSLTVTGNASFTTTTSTATFSGYIDIGRETVVNDCGGTTTNCTATCSSGKYIIGGGCYHGGGGAMYLQIGYPSSDYAWYCLFNNTGDVKAYAICARIK